MFVINCFLINRLHAGLINENRNTPSDEGDDFSYESINSILQSKILSGGLPVHKCRNYEASINIGNNKTKDFIFFTSDSPAINNPEKYSHVGTLFKIYGLKFHISLPENNENMRMIGWEIVKNSLINNKINTFKVIQKGKLMSEVEGQEGKDITIYANFNPELKTSDWRRILQDINQKLVDAGIKPGYRPQGAQSKPENSVPGSNYISYRYEDEFGESKKPANDKLLSRLSELTRQDTGATNGWPHFDAIAKHLHINVENQPDIPVLNKNQSSEEIGQQGISEYSQRPR